MPTFMVLRDLVRGSKQKRIVIPRGSKTQLEWLNEDTQQVLVRKGAVREVESPPLSELAGWQTRARRLEPHGIKTMDDMMEADANELAEALGVKSVTVEKWQDELGTWADRPEAARRAR